MDEGDRIVQGSVVDRTSDFAKMLGLANMEKVVAAFWGHGGYYLFQRRSDKERGCDEELSEQPAIATVVSCMHDLLGPTGIAVSIYKSTEWTDILKQQFSTVVDLYTTKALQHIYRKQRIVHCSMTIECELRFPTITREIRRGLLSRNLADYALMESGPAKTVRQILEFLVHTRLEDLGLPQPPCEINEDLYWREQNFAARLHYVRCVEDLLERHDGTIPTYVNFLVSVSPRAPRQFAQAVVNTVRNLNQRLGREIDMAEFLGGGTKRRKLEEKPAGIPMTVLRLCREALFNKHGKDAAP